MFQSKRRRSGPSGQAQQLEGTELEAQRRALEALATRAGLSTRQPWQAALARALGVSRQRISAAWGGSRLAPGTLEEWRGRLGEY